MQAAYALSPGSRPCPAFVLLYRTELRPREDRQRGAVPTFRHRRGRPCLRFAREPRARLPRAVACVASVYCRCRCRRLTPGTGCGGVCGQCQRLLQLPASSSW
eukprot:3933234-Rhodomonas_salina.1